MLGCRNLLRYQLTYLQDDVKLVEINTILQIGVNIRFFFNRILKVC